MNKHVCNLRLYYLFLLLLAVSTLHGQTAEEYAKSGNLKFSQEDFNGAIDDYTKWIELDPLNAIAYTNRGNAKSNIQDFEGAISDFTEAIEINPGAINAFTGRGYAMLNLEEYHGAIDDYTSAIALKPSTIAYFFRGVSHSHLGYYAEAIADFSLQIEIDPADEYAFIWRGNANMELKEYRNAINDFSKAIRINPNTGDSYLSRGKANIEVRDFLGALKDFTKAIELTPDDPWTHYYRGIVKLSIKDFKGAVADYTEAIKLDTEFYDSYLGRGKAKSMLQDFRGAIDDFTYSMKGTPEELRSYPENVNYVEAIYFRGLANIQSGRKDDACRDLGEAAELGKIEAFEEIYKNCNPTSQQLEYMLVEAVRNGNMPRVKELLLKGTNVNCVCNYTIPYETYYYTRESCTPINVACDSGNIEMARFLIEKGADVNTKNDAGMTPLMGNNNPDFVRLLIEKGADVNVKDVSGLTPLHMAQNSGIAGFLIASGADVNARDEVGSTPLHIADTIDMVRLLIEKGADINAKNNYGETPLYRALINNYADIAGYLLVKGSSTDSIMISGETPLIYAIRENQTDIVRLLIENGADVNPEWGDTPLHLSNNAEISRLLIDKGAAVNSRSETGATPLFYASTAEIASLLIEKGADVNAKDDSGNTPLHMAKSADIAKLLIDKGADVSAKNNYSNQTPLYYAESADIALLLIEKGAEVNAEGKSGTAPLFGALQRNKIDVAGMLIEKGANVNIRNHLGDTPLHLVGSDSLARLLIEKGADINAKDNNGKTPLSAAIETNNIPVLRVLLEKGIDVNVKDRFDDTPIFFVRSVEAASMLIEKGAEVNVRNTDGESPLHKAADAEVAKFLIRNGALIEAKDNDGQTPLMLAIQWRNDVAGVLIEAGADINARDNLGSTLVFNSGYINDEELIFLIEKGADIKIKNNFDLTPLHVSYSVTTDSILIANGADVNAKDIDGATPLHYTNDAARVRFLILNGADVNVLDNNGYTPFTSMLIEYPEFEAASELLKAGHPIDYKNDLDQSALIIVANESGEKESISYLLDNGADDGLRDKYGKTALDYSQALGKVRFINLLSTPPVIRTLHSNGQQAVIEAIMRDTSGIGKKDIYGKTLLHYMISDRCDTLLNYIISKFKNTELLNVLNSNHQTPLIYAIEQFNSKYALRLIEGGADINMQDDVGESPLFMAEYRNLENVASALRKKGAGLKSPGFPVELSLPMGHIGNITCFSISPDERTIISGDDNSIIKMWEVSSGKEIRTFKGHGAEILCLSISPDGRTFISGSADKTIILWDIQSGKELLTYYDDYAINILHFLPDGKSFISNNRSNDIRKWDMATGLELPGGQMGDMVIGRGDNLFLSPDGKYFIRNDFEGISLIDLETGKLKQRFVGKNISAINTVSISKDGKSLLASNDSIIRLWDLETGKELRTFVGNIRWIESLSFSPDGKTFITGRGQNVAQWDIQTGQIVSSFDFPDKWVTKFKYLSDGKSFISDNYDGTMDIRDITNGDVLKSFKGVSQFAFNFDVSKDGKNILVGSYSDIKLVNITTKIDLRNFPGHRYGTFKVNFSPDNRSFISAGADSIFRLWNIESGKITRSFIDNTFQVAGSCFSPDGKTLLTTGLGWSSACILWDIESGKELKVFDNWIYSVEYAPNGNSFLTGSSDTIILFDAYTHDKISSYAGHYDNINSLDFSPDGKSFISGSKDETIIQWDINNGIKPRTIYGHDGEITSVCYSDDGKSILSASTDRTMKLWNAANGQPVKTFTGHTGTVVNSMFHPSGRFLISSSDDKTIKYWNIDSINEVATMVLIDSLDWVLYSPDKYYATTKNGAKALGWVKGTQVWNFDQWDLQYNRPDIVFGRMPDPDTAMIKLYYKAYQKRLKKMNFSESMFRSDFHTPEIQIQNLILSAQDIIEVDVSAVDTIYSMDRINVWVNDVPVYGVNGISLRDEEQSIGTPLKKHLSISLSEGNNKIEVSVLNSAGAESLKKVTYAKNENSSVKKDLYFIAISCAEYKDDTYNLKYSVKDGRDMARQFAGLKGKFENIYIDTLFDSNVVLENLAALKEKLIRSKVDDEVILFTSGHGMLDDSLDFYFATYDVDFHNPALRGISFDDFENLLDSIPARKKLFLMDACHSGEVDKDEDTEVTASITSEKEDITFRSNVRAYGARSVDPAAQSGVTLNNSFELMQELFTGLDKGTGTTVISAAAGKGYALESPLWNNGVFTYSIINGLKNLAADKNKDGTITISELKDYSIKQVQDLTGGQQKPTARRESINYDWKIW